MEAMKEATAINVQSTHWPISRPRATLKHALTIVHVEEFKKELTREVMLMTQEVTRLQRERQGLEAHIADLFAFYAKQKQGVKVSELRRGWRKIKQFLTIKPHLGGQRRPSQNAQCPRRAPGPSCGVRFSGSPSPYTVSTPSPSSQSSAGPYSCPTMLIVMIKLLNAMCNAPLNRGAAAQNPTDPL